MARTYRSRFLAVLVEVERRMATEYEGLATAVAGEVARRALPDGTVPRTATPDILQAANARVLAFFVGPGRERTPFVVANGRMVPLSPYARALWAGITDGVRVSVEHQAALLERSLPPVVAARMRRATGNPFVAARAQVREQIFRPNRLAVYDAPHSWVDPNGYRLSDRIWNASGETRRRLDAYLEQAIREGRGAQEMAGELEQFLVPGRRLQRTNTPYGVDASFDGMRLARTEIARAHGHAAEASAAMNPFVVGLKIVLSGSHRKRDICDDAAMSGPWPPDAVPPEYRLPLHPACVLPGQMVLSERGYFPIEEVRPGLRVATHTGRYQPVTAAWSKSFGGTAYEVVTDWGRALVTGDHPLLTPQGWIQAEFLQPGQQICHAISGAGFDSFLSVANDTPAAPFQPSIPPNSFHDFGIMPEPPITLNAYQDLGYGHVEKVTAYPVLDFVDNSGGIQRVPHNHFERTRIGEPHSAMTQKHGHQAGVALAFGDGDFAPNFGPGCGVDPPIAVIPSERFAELDASCDGARPVIFLPTGGNGVAHLAHGDTMPREQAAQDAVGQAVAGENLRAGEPLHGVGIAQQISDGAIELAFESQGVPAQNVKAVHLGMGRGNAGNGRVTDGANNHDSLLSLSPDFGWGAESGNPVVGGVANPAQALIHYSTIRAIHQCHYSGPVYDLTVAGDHSFVVGGIVVHNCLCHYQNVMADTRERERILDHLEADMRRARAELVDLIGPLLVQEFTDLLLRDWTQATAEAQTLARLGVLA